MDTQQSVTEMREHGVWATVVSGGPSLQLLARIVEASAHALREAGSYALEARPARQSCPRAHPWEGAAGTCRAGPCGPDVGYAVVLGTESDTADDRARAGQAARDLLAGSARAGLIASVHAQPAAVPLARDHLRLMLSTSGCPQLVVFVRPLRMSVAGPQAGRCPVWLAGGVPTVS